MIAYGPSQVKPPAVQMLFHYWPNLKPPGAISEYRGLQYTGQCSWFCIGQNKYKGIIKSVLMSRIYSSTMYFEIFCSLSWYFHKYVPDPFLCIFQRRYEK